MSHSTRYQARARATNDREAHEASEMRSKILTEYDDGKPQPTHDHESFTHQNNNPKHQLPADFLSAAENSKKEELAAVVTENKALHAENGRLRAERNGFREDRNILWNQNKALNHDVNELKRELERKSTECNFLEQNVRGLMEKLNTVNTAQNQGWSLNMFSGTRNSDRAAEQLITELKTKLANDEWKIGGLQAENHKLQSEVAEHQKQLQLQTSQFSGELEAIKSNIFVNVPSLSDTAIQGKWGALCFSVRQFVSVHLPESLDLPTIQGLADVEHFDWLPDTLLRTPLLCPILLESWVWHFLCIRIFDSRSKHWAGEEGKILGILCDRFRSNLSNTRHSPTSADTVTKFHEWRVRSTHFMSTIAKPSLDNVVEVETGALLEALGPLTSCIKTQTDTNSGIYRDAHEILHQVIELAEFFRLARADFQVFITRVKLPLINPPSFGFRFDPETMEQAKTILVPRHNTVAPIVDLAVSPGLFKAGSSDGSHYHRERVLVKLQALCDVQSMLRLLKDGRGNGEESGRHYLGR
ncbi:uncharacterized protein B0H64DRAFT_190626 [Chaetomium fimeti]|uniref:Uncharacterized protein n=1 Tax=Chaetomium fimeti TaxID=1854472 RepID=A0AAE0HDK6_9PEZI|nr:hypothetical protein B0H64DRAFT_190626 [Chaetomium fimeti]